MEGIKKLDRIKYKLPSNVEDGKDLYILLDLLWKSNQLTFSNIPLWSRKTKAVFGKSEKKIKSAVIFLPMIGLPPTDFTCVYPTLKYINDLA